MMREYVFPIGVDKNGKKFQWVEDWDVEDCSECCFWEGRCMYKELNNNKKGEMMKDAVDATILDVDAQTIEFGLWPENLLDIKEGDKVKIIIVKEECYGR